MEAYYCTTISGIKILKFGILPREVMLQERLILLALDGGRKINSVMLCFSFKLIGRGSARAKGGTSTPDERKITTT